MILIIIIIIMILIFTRIIFITSSPPLYCESNFSHQLFVFPPLPVMNHKPEKIAFTKVWSSWVGNLPPGRRSFCFFIASPTATRALPSSYKSCQISFLSNKVVVTYDQVELAPQWSRLVDVTPEQPFWTFWTFVSHQRHHFKVYFLPIFFSGSLMWLARHVPFNQVDGDPIPPRQHGKSLLHLFGQSYQSEWFLK